MALSISRLSFEHHRQALGIGESEPRISWRFQGNVVDWEQSSYDIEVVRNGAKSVFNVNSSVSRLVPWPDVSLHSTERANVRVRAHGQPGQSSTPWSGWAAVETGLLSNDDWAGASVITVDRVFDTSKAKPPIYFRKDFGLDKIKEVASARLYITALGVFKAEVNGQVVGDHVLAPGWQSYHHRHVYNTYDITEPLKNGGNAIGVAVAEGWFSGRFFCFTPSRRNFYGDTIGLLSMIVVTFKDGTIVKVPTDDSWQAGTGPIRNSELYDGETYDSLLESKFEGWSTAVYDANGKSWLPVRTLSWPRGKLVSPDGPPIRRIEERKPQAVFKSPSGKTLVDFGQNLVGVVRLNNVNGPRGTNVTLLHAEVLGDNGELGLEPLRSAKATDTLILHGDGPQTWQPEFTFHGFRYAQVEGWPGELSLGSLTALVMHSDMEQTGWFQCSNPLLNQFHRNVRWSMKGNFVGVPTDCPQRDERMGWTGDAHAFGPTANYLYDTAGFWRDEPDLSGPPPDPTAVWGDVAVGGPWNLWLAYGDVAILEDQYAQSENWIDRGISRNDAGLWNRSTYQFGDWLDPKSPPEEPQTATTDKFLVADAYLIQMTRLIARISKALGKDDKAERYLDQLDKLGERFYEAWVDQDGCLADCTQTAYALGLHFNIFKETHRAKAAETLRRIISENDHLIGTGFAGTQVLGFALRDVQATDDFYRMLLQTRVPSWLYQVVQNGTTTWERWDSLLPDGSLNTGSMTSFNHYSLGSVADWMHQVIGGLSPATPGWKTFNVLPIPGGNITSAEATFISGYGEIKSKWWIEDDKVAPNRCGFHLSVQVPPNSRAIITLPGSQESKNVGSGYYEFYVPEFNIRGTP